MEDFQSRRSPVISVHGCIASSQPLATQAGIGILQSGGNAADAAVAVAAALNVTEPCSTGIGGDCFCLFYDAKSKTVHGLNGSGRSPGDLLLEMLNNKGYDEENPLPVHGALTVTVPGAAAGWMDTIEKFGSKKLSLREILDPAISLAEDGFPVHPVSAHFWEQGSFLLKDPQNKYGGDMLLNGKSPRAGEVMKMPLLANTFKELASSGKSSFYEGRIGEAIVNVVQEHGGVLSLDDLKNHTTTYDEPICVDYKGVRVWEMPPNGQGITALMALNILQAYDLKGMGHNSSQYLHTLIEALRLSFADTTWHCTDPSQVNVPIKEMLSEKYAAERRKLIDLKRAITDATRGSPANSSDTVYFSVVDGDGNACSFIVSNYMGFGTGLVPHGCGFTLQNRGAGFNLQPDHPNVVAPNKRPFHTIIPAMATSAESGELLASFGVMGGFMQPQGHVQVLLNMLEFGMDPQAALDQPRFCIGPGHLGISSTISLEHGINSETLQELVDMGHLIEGPISGFNRSIFGRGQIITKGAWWSAGRNPTDQLTVCDDCKVLWAGSDPRADGMAAAVLMRSYHFSRQNVGELSANL